MLSHLRFYLSNRPLDIIFFLICILFCSCGHHKMKDDIDNKSISPESGGIFQDNTEQQLKLLQTTIEIKELFTGTEEKFPGVPGFYFQDINGGYTVGLRENETFPAASVVKVPIMVEIFRQITDGKMKLDDTLILKEEEKVDGSGILKDIEEGRRFTILELLSLMITKSDNTASDLLLKRAGMESINNTMKEMHLSNTCVKRRIFDFEDIDRGLDNITTSRDLGILLFYIYGESGHEGGRKMMDILKKQERRDMLPARLPAEVEIAHKTGELSGILLDAGIVLYEKRPYILCLLGKDITSREDAINLYAHLSQKVYDVIMRNFP